jgi:tetratricopeptide (TPR) repeat protein
LDQGPIRAGPETKVQWRRPHHAEYDPRMNRNNLLIVAFMTGSLALADAATAQVRALTDADVHGCALFQGLPAVDACDAAMRSDLPVEIRAEAAWRKGIELAELARYGDAVTAYRAALRLAPGYVEAHYSLGVALIMLGRPGPALREFRRIVDLTPGDADAHYNLGLALNNVGRHADAVRAYRAAVRLRPDYTDAWGNLGLAAHLIGRHRQSAAAFERAKALEPTYFDSRPRQHAAFESSRGGTKVQ